MNYVRQTFVSVTTFFSQATRRFYARCLACVLILTAAAAIANERATAIEIQPCPEQFNSVKIHTDGKFCQVFAAEFPASMVMHVTQAPASVVDFYANEYPVVKEIKSRTVMQTEDKNTTLIISSDGEGTQVDILVKSI